MSACVSGRGEYSEHTLAADFYCMDCGVFDEAAALHDAYNRGRVQALLDAARDVRAELATEVSGHTSTYSVRVWLRQRAQLIVAGERP